MGHNFNRGAINICHSYKKLKKIPTFFPNVNVALLYENLSCAKIQSLGWKYFELLEIFILPLGKHCTVRVCGFFPCCSLGFQRFFYSHIMQEKLLDGLCPTFWRDHNFWQSPRNKNSSLIGIFFPKTLKLWKQCHNGRCFATLTAEWLLLAPAKLHRPAETHREEALEIAVDLFFSLLLTQIMCCSPWDEFPGQSCIWRKLCPHTAKRKPKIEALPVWGFPSSPFVMNVGKDMVAYF